MHNVILVVSIKRITKECIANKLIQQENDFKNYLIPKRSKQRWGGGRENDRINRKKYWVDQKSSFGFFCNTLQKNPNELFGQANSNIEELIANMSIITMITIIYILTKYSN